MEIIIRFSITKYYSLIWKNEAVFTFNLRKIGHFKDLKVSKIEQIESVNEDHLAYLLKGS